MWGLRFNNEKSWFEAHREEFQRSLNEPMKALCDDIFAALDGEYPELGLRHKVSRIYRDARRLHGAGPYRDHLWCSFEQPTEEFAATPVFWFELSPDSWSYGMLENAKNYKNYSGIADDTDGSVRFIIKTAAIGE